MLIGCSKLSLGKKKGFMEDNHFCCLNVKWNISFEVWKLKKCYLLLYCIVLSIFFTFIPLFGLLTFRSWWGWVCFLRTNHQPLSHFNLKWKWIIMTRPLGLQYFLKKTGSIRALDFSFTSYIIYVLHATAFIPVSLYMKQTSYTKNARKRKTCWHSFQIARNYLIGGYPQWHLFKLRNKGSKLNGRNISNN